MMCRNPGSKLRLIPVGPVYWTTAGRHTGLMFFVRSFAYRPEPQPYRKLPNGLVVLHACSDSLVIWGTISRRDRQVCDLFHETPSNGACCSAVRSNPTGSKATLTAAQGAATVPRPKTAIVACDRCSLNE